MPQHVRVDPTCKEEPEDAKWEPGFLLVPDVCGTMAVMREKQKGAALDAEISATAERIDRAIDGMVADLRQLKRELNRRLKQKQKQTNYRGGPDGSE